MQYETTVKKYRILDYSKMSMADIFIKFRYFIEKQQNTVCARLTHKYIKEQFSIMLNLHNIMEELYKRHPELKEAIDFDSELNEIIKNNAINASKN